MLFSDDYANSHFILGCVLVEGSPNRMINLYYKASTEPLPPLTEEQIQYADVDGNVGLKINGRRHILLALRQIVTETIPERFRGLARNCETSDMKNNTPSAMSPVLKRDTTTGTSMSYCDGSDAPCETASYFTFFGPGKNETIFTPEWKKFVDGDGALIIQEAYRAEACANWMEVYGPSAIVLETCSARPQ